MRVLVFAPAFAPGVRSGGPARSVTNLVDQISDDHDVVVVTTDRDHGINEPYPGLGEQPTMRGRAQVYYTNLGSADQMRRTLASLRGQPFDLILLNSVWHWKLSILPAMLSQAGVLRGPVVLMPRGELEPGALALKQTKKRVGGAVLRRLYGRVVDAFGSTSASEAEQIARWFPGKTVVLTSNTPEAMAFGGPEEPSEQLRAVFLSRIHPTKGLLELLRGLSRTTEPIRLVAKGPVESAEYWQRCQQVAATLPPTAEFSYEGMASREEVGECFRNADCMVLLTAGENYGHVIAESLQAGCPVIAAPTTPWTDALRAGGGDVVEDREDADEVAAVLDRWARKSDAELAQARLDARSAFEEFSNSAAPNIVVAALAALAAEAQLRP